MRLTGFPDLLGLGQRNRTIAGIKSRLDVVSQEAVTGLQADITKATGGMSGQAHLVFKALEDLDQSERLGALANTRLDLTSQAISAARSSMNGLSTRAVVAFEDGGATGVRIISLDAEANLRSAMSSLGAQQGSRNLLSGAATDQTTFADTDVLLDDVRNIMKTAGDADAIQTALDDYFDSPTGGFQTNIYQGADSDAPPLNIGNGNTVNMGVRGDSQAIRDSLRGMAVVATASDAPLDEDDFRQVFLSGAAKAGSGESGLVEAEGQLGIIADTLAKTQSRDQFERISLNTTYQSLIGRDQFEAVSELQQLEVALESSYIITSRLSGLSLSNYLR